MQWLEAQLLSRDAELHQLGLVDADGVVVGFGGVVDAVLEILDGDIFILDGFLDLTLDFLDYTGF